MANEKTTSSGNSPSGRERDLLAASDDLFDANTDPGTAAHAATYLAQLHALEVLKAQRLRENAIANRNKAVTAILKGKWGGPIVLGLIGVVALVVVGVFAMAGVDVSGFATGLADAAAHAWTGCPVQHSPTASP